MLTTCDAVSYEGIAHGQAACPAGAPGKAGHHAAGATDISDSHALPAPLSVPISVNRAAAGQQASASTGVPASMPPPSMPRRTAVKQPAGTATCAAEATSAAAEAGATTLAAGTASAATAGTAGSKVSSQDKRQQSAKAYLARLQEGLPSAAYQQLMKHLQRYRKDHDTLQVTDGVLDVLRLPARRHLLLDFAAFLRTQDRDWFLRCVK